jgi:hypothetical protein
MKRLAPLLFFALLALLLTWPLPLHLADRLPATPGEGTQDLWQNLWNLWWVGAALERGQPLFTTDALYYPNGASLLFHPLNITSGLLAVPLQLFGSLTIAYNLLVLLSFTLGGYALYLLLQRQQLSVVASLLGGVVYVTANFQFVQLNLGHLEQISRQWLPLYALALDHLLRDQLEEVLGRKTLLTLLLTALALLAVMFTSLYMALFAGLLTGIWLLWEAGAALRRRQVAHLKPLLLRVGLLSVLVGGITLPTLLIPMAQERVNQTYMLRSLSEAERGSSAPLDLLLPSETHPLSGVVNLPNPQNPGAFPGYLALALALLSLLHFPLQTRRWLLLAIVAWLFSLGPSFPLYRWLYELPPIQAARYPGHFSVLLLVALGVLAGFGSEAVLRRVRPKQPNNVSNWAIATLLLALVLFEQHPRGLALVPPISNPFYQQLATMPERFSVLELPINRANNMWVDMAAQTIHGKDLLYGGLARPVPRPPFENMPLFRELEYPDQPRDVVQQNAVSRQDTLRFYNLRYLIYHRSNELGPVTPPSAEVLAQVASLPVRQIYSDAELVAFQIELPNGTANLEPVAFLGDGWYNREPTPAGAQRWLRAGNGEISVYANQATTVRLQVTVVAFHQPRQIRIEHNGQTVGEVLAQPWPTDIQKTLELPAGTSTVRLVASDPGTSPQSLGQGDDPRALTIAVLQLRFTP